MTMGLQSLKGFGSGQQVENLGVVSGRFIQRLRMLYFVLYRFDIGSCVGKRRWRVSVWGGDTTLIFSLPVKRSGLRSTLA